MLCMFDSLRVQVPFQPDGGEGLAKRKGSVVRRGLKEAQNKGVRRWMYRYWFEDAGSNLEYQMAFLRGVKRLTRKDLETFTDGLSIPESIGPRPPIQPVSYPGWNKGGFQILQHVTARVQRSGNYWARCPSCAKEGRDRAGDNLAISIADPRFYKCWAGCTREMIRTALGQPIHERSHR